jgi:hypothetical protein
MAGLYLITHSSFCRAEFELEFFYGQTRNDLLGAIGSVIHIRHKVQVVLSCL